jgi:hypothetical protein
LFVTSYSKIRIQNRIQSIKVDLKEDKVRKKVMQEFERYKVYFKSKVRIRMTKLTLTKTREDGSIGTSSAGAETASNTSSVTASVDGLVAADTAAINSAADTMAVPLPMLLPPVTIAGWDDAESESSSDDDPDDPDDESSSDDDSDDEVPLADDAFLSRRLPEAVDTVGAKEGATSLGATTTDGGVGGGRGLAAFNALAMSYKDFLYDSSSFFLVDFDCLGDFGATVLVEAAEFFFDSIVFMEEDFDCVGDLGASASGTEGAATAGLALTVPGTVERVRS